MINGKDIGLVYREVQHFRQFWIWMIILALSLISFWGFVQQIILNKPFGNNPAPDSLMIVLVVVFGFGFPIFFYALNLTTEVHDDGVYFRYFPFHISFRKIGLEDINGFDVKTLINEYTIDPGDTVQHKIFLTNNGNSEDSIDLKFVKKPQNWFVKLMRTNDITLDAFESTNVDLVVSAPEQVKAGEYNISIEATLHGDESSKYVNTTAIIDRTYDFELNVKTIKFM